MKYTVYENFQYVFDENCVKSIVPAFNTQIWYRYRTYTRHRTEGPAYISRDCIKYLQNEDLHRTDGPALIYINDDEYHYALQGEIIPVNNTKEFIQYQKLQAFQ